MAPRDKARGRNAKALIEEYALIINGAPATCRWQELKDFIREYAPHNRQAEMYEDENGKPTGQGSVIITRLEEAQRAYRALSRKGWDGHCIRVALAKRVNGGELDTIEGPTTSPEFPTQGPNSAVYANPSRHLAAVSPPLSPRSNRYPSYSSAADPTVAYYATAGTGPPLLASRPIADAPSVMTMPYSSLAVSPHYAPYPDANYGDGNNVPQYHPHMLYNNAPAAYSNDHHVTAPTMARQTTNRPQASRATDTPIVSPNRTVFLTKLPYSAVGQAVRRLLENYGRVERCDVPLDRNSPNRIQGTAIAKFKETNDAARAIRSLNGSVWKGVTISARWDRDSAGTTNAAATSGRPGQARQSASVTGRVADARRDDDGARDQRRRAGEGPLIVNGSRGDVAQSRRRRGSKEDDSDSSEDDDDGDDDGDSSSDEDARPRARGPNGKRH